MNNSEKTSLERSHSKSSNAKLTLLALLSAFALSVSVCAVGTVLAGLLENLKMILYIVAGVSLVIFVLTVMLFSKFTR